MSSVTYIQLALAVAALYVVKRLVFDKQRKAPLPPGPKGLPILGNIKDLPPPGQPEWLHWKKLKDGYGPISSITVLGQTLVLIHDSKAAIDLMERRSTNYSSRPRLVFGFEMCGWKDTISSLPYGPRHRTARKYAYSILGTKAAVSKFYPLQEAEVRRFLFRTMNNPADVIQHIRTEAGAIILKATYDYTIEPHSRDPLVDLADAALAQFSSAVTAGAWMVDMMPFLKYMPDWVPGTDFKRTARLWHKTLMDVVDRPFTYVKQQMAQKHYHPSFVSKLLEEPGQERITPESEFIIKWSAASLYTGGADTTVSTLSCFFLAMTLFPEVQRKAQEEIDRIVGTARLPTFEDRDNLRYVEAVVTEALRWHPVAPLAIPHLTEEDDIYDGYLLPKGSLIIANSWWLLHDPKVYNEPMEFKPERFLGENAEPDARNYCYGYGRRICPGRVLADSSVFLTIASALAAFNISKATDANGKEIEPKVEFTPGIISHPVPFGCTIKPRSEVHEQLIKNVEVEYPWEESDAKALQSAQQ
ncbi:cytochrome P450 [Rhizodiscina lignyota]|uniref:Cytochrome P450 n=1 Tax=Rhizodiscina lignyota TaxID=1504668 RepID=A0A9P4IMI1_9PEZI|nr:cytochrome P450 [Rhizodiscina lignyota]